MSLLAITLRPRRTALLAWSLGTLAYLLIIGMTYSFVADSPEYEEIWASMPEGARELLGGAASLSEVDGYFDSQAGAYLPLVLGILAITGMARALAGAEESGALDHALARPITRKQYYWAQVRAMGVLLLAILSGALLGAILGFLISGVSGRELAGVVGLMAELIPLLAMFVATGALAGALAHRAAPANGAGIGLVLVWFLLDALSRVVDAASWLAYLTPFGYAARSDLYHGQLDWLYALVAALFCAGVLWLGARVFDGKDLHG